MASTHFRFGTAGAPKRREGGGGGKPREELYKLAKGGRTHEWVELKRGGSKKKELILGLKKGRKGEKYHSGEQNLGLTTQGKLYGKEGKADNGRTKSYWL